MKLDTVDKAKEFVKELGVLEFVFMTEGVLTFKTLIPEVKNKLVMYEVNYFTKEGMTFYKHDSQNDFLENLEIFEIVECYLDCNETKILYHRKYKSDEVLNGNEQVLGNINSYIVPLDSLVIPISELEDKELPIKVQISNTKALLKHVVEQENFEKAGELKKIIEELESRLK